MFCFCCGWILLASAYYKNIGSWARLFKKLDIWQSKVPQLSILSISTKTIIETSREYFNISTFGRKHQASVDNVLILQKLYELVWLTGTKTTYLAVRNYSRFSTKISIWTCWDVGVEIPSDFRTSGLNNCLGKVVQIATKRLSICWRKSATGSYGS